MHHQEHLDTQRQEYIKMKVLTLNFLTCAVKACKSSNDSFPLHPKDAELVHDDIEINPELLVNVLPRIDWTALKTTSTEVGFFFFWSLSTHLMHYILLLGLYISHPLTHYV